MIEIPAPCDMHVHFRQGLMLGDVVAQHDRVFEYALAMPNLTPPVSTAMDAWVYKKVLQSHCKRMKPLVAIKLLPTTTPEMIEAASKDGILAAKLYPAGATTNSDDGIKFDSINHQEPAFMKVLDTMQQLGMILCVHGEVPNAFCIDAETKFLPALSRIMYELKTLKVVLEHITTDDAIGFVRRTERCAATITLHHLMITLDDVVGRKLRPHNFCLPIAKRERDREALQHIVQVQHPRFFFGSDSAPHAKDMKECAECCAGCYTAPLLMEGLCELFPDKDTLKLFTCDNARAWYNLPAPSYTIQLIEKEWTVPNEISGIVPFMAGRKMKWSLV